ncbi:DUF6562 domain-containing protein [Phocaeicola dorei]|uniref:DUF6562 domain-containing protein n=1 Tax=Phocaeicola dorei TaxID=357276 RepID=UPI000B36D22F|nr:DUF6562 domain-containing protein [Phocaeicola dorei]OUP95566.1 hypothetical protein B5F00_00500 [Phocaeicola dorei]
MNKKLFLGMFAAAGMLLATSCSNDELDVVQSGNEAQVTFSLGLEGGIATRAAISDGTGAKKLVYAVYKLNADGTPVLQNVVGSNNEGQFVDTEAFDGGLTETVSVTLAKGQTYQVAFWAQNPNCNAYTTTDLTNVEVSYNQATNNNDVRDAFFKTVEFTVSGNQTIDVELKRPFAQINVGVYKTDWEAAVKSGIEIEKSSVVIKDAATSINLLTGEVGDETTDVEVSYLSNTIPNEDLKVDLNGDKDYDDENEKYKWLSMSYILVADRNADSGNGVLGDERDALESLQYTFSPKSGNEITFGDGLNSVPVQRNWRTNILGQILTGNIEFNIRINPIFDGDINVDAPTSEVKSDAQALAAALTANEEDILVVLGADVDLPISSLGSQTSGSGEYKLGGADTKNITIDLNGKTLNFTTSYMSAIGANNPDATITIKNGTVTSTGNSATTWNINDVTFANCNYVIENVTFNKEVALTNAGKSVTMNDVTINGTGDYYALWISAKGQTVKVDNLKINTSGRGIKIDEQYVGAPAKVTLDISNSTFKTTKKAAIMVKSVEGADITVSDIDISNVTADKVFAVWVDEDAKANADKVVVNGALMKVEGDNAVIGAASTEELANATIGNNATIYLAAGDYIIPSTAKGKTLTIKGTGNPEDVKVAVTKVGTGGENCDYGFDGSTVTFEGITITTNSSTYIGYARCKGTYKNCVINGTYTLYDDSKFENCTFNVSGDVYNIWTWGAPNAKFDKCTFNSDGKAMLLYGTVNTNLTIENSVFNDKGGLTDLKAAIEIGNDYSKSYILVVNNTVVNGYEINDKGINTGTTLWANKNSMGTDKLSVTIDGVKVY